MSGRRRERMKVTFYRKRVSGVDEWRAEGASVSFAHRVQFVNGSGLPLTCWIIRSMVVVDDCASGACATEEWSQQEPSARNGEDVMGGARNEREGSDEGRDGG